MTTLSLLAAREAELSDAAARVVGIMEEKEAALADTGVFAGYAAVLEAYVALFNDPGAGPEALKRAAFLIWYEVAEPACFSGIRDLPESVVRATLAWLDTAAEAGRIDRELSAMLGYYQAIADFAFTRAGVWPALSGVLAESNPEAWRQDVAPPAERWARGLLSDYWGSISRAT